MFIYLFIEWGLILNDFCSNALNYFYSLKENSLSVIGASLFFFFFFGSPNDTHVIVNKPLPVFPVSLFNMVTWEETFSYYSYTVH